MRSALARGSSDVLVLLAVVHVVILIVHVVDGWRLEFFVEVADTLPVFTWLHLMLLEILHHPECGTVVGHVLSCHGERSVGIDPVTIGEGLASLREAIQELGLVVASDTDEVMIVHQHVLEALGYERLRSLLLEVSVLDERSDFVLDGLRF